MVRGPYVGIPQLVNEMTKRTVNVGSLFRQLNNAPGSCRGFFCSVVRRRSAPRLLPCPPLLSCWRNPRRGDETFCLRHTPRVEVGRQLVQQVDSGRGQILLKALRMMAPPLILKSATRAT